MAGDKRKVVLRANPGTKPFIRDTKLLVFIIDHFINTFISHQIIFKPNTRLTYYEKIYHIFVNEQNYMLIDLI